MKTKVFLAIAVRIIILFVIGMFATFLPDYLRDFFGDSIADNSNFDWIDTKWNWGARHYWYWWMMFILFILALLNLVLGIINVVKKNYDTSNW